MRAPAGFIVVAIAAFSLAGCAVAPGSGGGQADAACAAPIVTGMSETVEPGQTLALVGEGWGPCNDTPNDLSAPPWKSVTVEWGQDDQRTELTTFDIADSAFSGEVVVPTDAAEGGAVIYVIGDDYSLYVPLMVETGE
jgi:hypothetical protein